MIYFDHAATTPLDENVLNAMMKYLKEDFGNSLSAHSYGRRAMAGVDMARDTLAKGFSVKPSEIYFTSGGSESNSWALKSFALAEPKKRIIVSSIEHHSVLNAAKELEREGMDIAFLPVDGSGKVRLDALEELLKKPTSLVCVMAANNETGILQPVDKIGKLAHDNGAYYFSDCVQLAPYAPVPVEYADMISVSAHKAYGPKGVGALYIKSKTPVYPLIFGGEQERGLRGGTTNVAGVVGMAEAFLIAEKTRGERNKKMLSVRDYFEKRIEREFPFASVFGKGENRLCSVSSVSFKGKSGAALLYRLDMEGIAASLGSACASGSIEPSHVLMECGLSYEDAMSTVRFSFGVENTKEEVDTAVSVLKNIFEEI